MQKTNSVSAVITLFQLRTIYLQHSLSYFIHDSAYDNTATYKLYKLVSIIDLNPKIDLFTILAY